MIKGFVYGTSLMKDGRYHQYYLQGSKYLGKGFVEGYKKYILGGVDGIIPEEGERVQGEVYEIDPAVIPKLDFLMHYGTSFIKRMLDVEMDNGETIQAEAYIWTGSVAK